MFSATGTPPCWYPVVYERHAFRAATAQHSCGNSAAVGDSEESGAKNVHAFLQFIYCSSVNEAVRNSDYAQLRASSENKLNIITFVDPVRKRRKGTLISIQVEAFGK
jgi:hypothetical protein